MCVYDIDGKSVVTDTERIAVVPDDRGPRAQVFARRLHGETCARYVAELERDKLRAEKEVWEREQRAKLLETKVKTTNLLQQRRGNRTRGM